MEIAIDLTAQKGLGRVNHTSVAKAAGVAGPTIFSYFANREELDREIRDEVGRFIVGFLTLDGIEELPFKERLVALGVNSMELMDTHLSYCQVWAMWGAHFGADERIHYKKYEDSFTATLSTMLLAEAGEGLTEQAAIDRSRVMLSASVYLVRMEMDGVSRKRQIEFFQHMIDFAVR